MLQHSEIGGQVRHRHQELSLHLLRVMRVVDALEGRFATAMGYQSPHHKQARKSVACRADLICLFFNVVRGTPVFPGARHSCHKQISTGYAPALMCRRQDMTPMVDM